MNNFQKVLRNTIFLASTEMVLKILGFLWIVYLGRALTVGLFGTYSVVNSFITIFSFLPELGIGLIVVREIAKNKNKADEYLTSSFSINIMMAIITIISIFITGKLLHYPQNLMLLLFIASITLLVGTLRSAPLYFFEGTENMKMVSVTNFFNTLFLIGGAMVGFSLSFSLLGIFLGMLGGTVVSLVLSYMMFLKHHRSPRIVFSIDTIRNMVFMGLPLAIASFSFLVYTRIESIILLQFLGDKAVGVYNSSTPFVLSLMQLLNVPFVMALYPTLVKLFEEDKTRFKNAIKKSLLVISLWSFPSAFIIHFFAPVIIPFFFGEKFNTGIPVLQILIFFVPFASLSALLYKILIIYNRQKLYMVINLIGAGIDILLNIVLIKNLGLIGAAYASVITQFVLLIIFGFAVWRINVSKK